MRIRHHIVRVRVRNPKLPVPVRTRLPRHLVRVIGIKCVHTVGVETIKPDAESISRIGWFTIDLNNRKKPLGVFEVGYQKGIDASEDYQSLNVEIQKGSLITGTYNNELDYSYNPLSDSNDGILVSIYLKCLSDEDEPINPTEHTD